MDIDICARPDYRFQHDNPDFQALMRTLTATSDPEKRTNLLHQAQRMITTDYVNSYLFQPTYPTVADARLRGLPVNRPTQATDLTKVGWAE